MHLVQLLLPLYGREGKAVSRDAFDTTRDELAARFGGVTAFVRSPAVGLWNGGDKTDRDDLLMYEVLVQSLDHEWWRDYRKNLERRFRQESVLLLALPAEQL